MYATIKKVETLDFIFSKNYNVDFSACFFFYDDFKRITIIIISSDVFTFQIFFDICNFPNDNDF